MKSEEIRKLEEKLCALEGNICDVIIDEIKATLKDIAEYADCWGKVEEDIETLVDFKVDELFGDLDNLIKRQFKRLFWKDKDREEFVRNYCEKLF